MVEVGVEWGAGGTLWDAIRWAGMAWHKWYGMVRGDMGWDGMG